MRCSRTITTLVIKQSIVQWLEPRMLLAAHPTLVRDILPGNLGGAHDDRLYGDAGNDVLSGNDGKDVMYGGDGDDQITGGAGWDLHSGQAGNDRLFARDGRDDEVLGGDGNDSAERDDSLDVLLAVETEL